MVVSRVAQSYQMPTPLPTAVALPQRITNRLDDIEGDAMAVSVKMLTATGHLQSYPTHDAACDAANGRNRAIGAALLRAAMAGTLTRGEVATGARRILANCDDYDASDALEDATVHEGIAPCVAAAHAHARDIPHKIREICEGRRIGRRSTQRGQQP